MEVVFNFFKDLFGDKAFLGLVLVMTCGFFIWWLRGIKDSLKKLDKLPCEKHDEIITNLTKTTNKIDNLPCENHTSQLSRQGDNYHSLDKTVTKIETSLSYISKMVTENSLSHQETKGFTQRNSPLALTKEGTEMVARLEIDKAIDKNWNSIKKMIDSEVTEKTAYDIDQYSMEQAVVFPEKFIDDDTIKRVKEDAYSKGMSIVAYMKAVAVIVRDRYCMEKNIDTSKL